jgi:hypothetical protein
MGQREERCGVRLHDAKRALDPTNVDTPTGRQRRGMAMGAQQMKKRLADIFISVWPGPERKFIAGHFGETRRQIEQQTALADVQL